MRVTTVRLPFSTMWLQRFTLGFINFQPVHLVEHTHVYYSVTNKHSVYFQPETRYSPSKLGYFRPKSLIFSFSSTTSLVFFHNSKLPRNFFGDSGDLSEHPTSGKVNFRICSQNSHIFAQLSWSIYLVEI